MIRLALIALLLVPAPAEAAWRPDVQEARTWLKTKMPPRQFRCLHRLWSNESGWQVRKRGPMTKWGRAYGIPQALPGRKMRKAGRDWRTNAVTQVRWGWWYIKGRYDARPCKALRFQNRRGWY
jgi:hypothetical protein